jgi:hypothetical protein
LDFPTHYLVLYLIAAAALAVWLCGLWFLVNTTRRTVTASELWEDDDEMLVAVGDGTIRGSAEVAGRPAELAVKAAAQLAQHGITGLGPVTVLDQSDDRVAFEAMPGLGARFLRRGVLNFHSIGADRTAIDYSVLVPRRTGLLAAAWIIQAIGLVALIVGFLAIHSWVAPHPNPAVHWQSAQMVQVIHFLWPPFLFGALYRRVQTHVRNTFDSLANNLPYLKN